MENMSLTIPFFSGLLALLGGFFGAWLTRRTEYDKWLRQQRGIEFSSFIQKLSDVQSKAGNILYGELSSQKKDLEITELFCSLDAQENIVRLYLSKKDRDSFSGLKHDMWVFYSPDTKQSIRMKNHKELLDKIQNIFERNLEANQSFHWTSQTTQNQ